MFDPSNADEAARALTAFGEIVDLAVGLDGTGTITGEHGVGWLKRQWLAGYLGREAMELNRRIKKALDPPRHPQPGRRALASPLMGGQHSRPAETSAGE